MRAFAGGGRALVIQADALRLPLPDESVDLCIASPPLQVPGNAPQAANNGGLWRNERVGPWREYHLDGFKAPPTRPAVVLDPFSGVGTTCLVARALGRIGIGVDLSHAYSRAARWRVFESGEWQDIIARTTGRKVKPLPKHDPAQARLL